MDGNLAPLPALADLCEACDAWLMVDDAHATGVLGATGAGSAEAFGLHSRVPVQFGTLSKALASEGGFVAGSRVLIEWLRNRARSFVFSTAPAPSVVAAAHAAAKIARQEPALRERLASNIRRLKEGLTILGLPVRGGETPILPVVLGAAETALAWSAALETEGIWVPAIRPPTVPPGTARLRISVSAAHTDADLEEALAAFQRVKARLGTAAF
jgi:7-keto-8-aminopelargonate synthetase-like enzyme